MEFSVIKGDIAAQEADVLVNAAGTSLRMGSGVAGSLRRHANGPIDQEALEKGPISLGEVAATSAYDLDATYVLHAAAMPHYGDGLATEVSIRKATRNALAEADSLTCASLIIPVLGTGAAGFPFEEGATYVCEEIASFSPTTLSDVSVIAYTDDQHTRLERVAKRVRSAD